MKCLILAAGYATRLYPLTKNFPKPLLEVGGKTIADRLIDDISSTGCVDTFIIVTNHRYAGAFETWAAGRRDDAVIVIDDGTVSNEGRLGAVKDIRFVVEKLGMDEDLFVVAGDNVLDFSLSHFLEYAREKVSTCIMRYYEPDVLRLRRCGVIELGEDDLVLGMQEKPEDPRSHWCCPPFYYFTREAIGKLDEGILAGCGTDSPGAFVSWLVDQVPVYALEMPGKRYDIGDLESYTKVCNEYEGIL